MKILFKVYDPNAEYEEMYYETPESAADAIRQHLIWAACDGGPCMITITMVEMSEEAFEELVRL